MSVDKRSLLAMIGSNPDEDTPRLAFADWCDEHDEPERAWFIRLQFEVVRHSEDSSERAELESQALAILKAHHHEWLADEPAWAKGPLSRFSPDVAVGLYGTRHGFPEHVRFTREDYLANATAFLATAPIRNLAIEEISDGGRALAGLVLPNPVPALTLEFSITVPHWPSVLSSPVLQGVRNLSLHLFGDQHLSSVNGGITWDEHEVLDDDGAVAIAGCAQLSGLTSLTLGRGSIGPPGMKALVNSPHLSGLESLLLRDHPIQDEGLIHLSRSPLASRLTELDLTGTQVGYKGLRAFFTARPVRLGRLRLGSYGPHQVTGDGLDALFRCEALTALTDLHLTGAPLTTQLVRVFANNPCFAGLKTLCIGQSNFDDRMAEELAASPYLRNLRVIDLQNNVLGAQGMSALARSPVLDTVTSLELHNTGDFSDAGAIALAGSGHAQNLRRLSVVSTRLGLEGLRAIANSPHLAQLRSLNVENSRFGDKGARALCDSPYFQKIRELRVNDCGISDQMKAALRKRFGSSVTL